MIFDKYVVIGEVYIIANFLIFFKNLKKKYFVEVNETVHANNNNTWITFYTH